VCIIIIGRILNRYIKDIGCMDDQLPENFFELINVCIRLTNNRTCYYSIGSNDSNL